MTKNPVKIVFVEDDIKQGEYLFDEVVWKILPDAQVKYFESEYAFLEAANSGELTDWKPHFALIDLLLRFYSPKDLVSLEMRGESPMKMEDLKRELGGVRCRAKLSEVCPDTKVAIMTVLDDEPDGIVIKKGSDDADQQIRELLCGD